MGQNYPEKWAKLHFLTRKTLSILKISLNPSKNINRTNTHIILVLLTIGEFWFGSPRVQMGQNYSKSDQNSTFLTLES